MTYRSNTYVAYAFAGRPEFAWLQPALTCLQSIFSLLHSHFDKQAPSQPQPRLVLCAGELFEGRQGLTRLLALPVQRNSLRQEHQSNAIMSRPKYAYSIQHIGCTLVLSICPYGSTFPYTHPHAHACTHEHSV